MAVNDRVRATGVLSRGGTVMTCLLCKGRMILELIYVRKRGYLYRGVCQNPQCGHRHVI